MVQPIVVTGNDDSAVGRRGKNLSKYKDFYIALTQKRIIDRLAQFVLNWWVVGTFAHFLGFEFLVRNEENILLSHEKRGKFEESLNSLYLPNFKFYCILIDNFWLFQNSRNFLLNKPNFASQKPF